MIELDLNSIPLKVKSLFKQNQPQAKRCFAVLDGIASGGRVLTNDLANPGWAVVQEPYDQTVFFGGKLDRNIVTRCITVLRQETDVLVGFWIDDPLQELLPPDPDYDGAVLEFYDRPVGQGLEKLLGQVPAECKIQKLNANTILKTAWGPDDVRTAGSMENWIKHYLGYGLIWNSEVLAEAMAGPPSRGIYEPGVFTKPEHRGKGYGTMVSAMLVQEVEALGGVTYWNCAKQNLASAAIARKLGYRVEKEYHLLAWQKAN